MMALSRPQSGGTRIAVGIAATSLALTATACTALPEPGSPPNILFIFADDHAYQAISAYGSVLNRTPNIDRIAAEGLRFDRALVTNSICAPSRAVVLTGKYSHLNGVIDNAVEFDGGQATFPKLLQQRGYQTAAFGKWHLKSAPTGFDTWEVLPGQGHYYNPDLRTSAGTVRHEGYVTDIVTDLALDWLRDRDARRPFFMWLGHKAPHRNWMPGPAHLDTYEDAVFPEPPTLFDDYSNRASPASAQEMEIDRHMTLLGDLALFPSLPQDDNPEWDARRWNNVYGRLTDAQRTDFDAAFAPGNRAFRDAPPQGDDLVRWKYRRYLQNYLRTIASVDDNVGRILDALEELGLADNTIVVYSSDQGFYLGEHGWFDKRWIYEPSLRTPLLVRWPGVVTPGSSSATIVSNLDFAETFLEAAGASVPDDMQGRSLLPLLRGGRPDDWRDSFYYHYYEAEGAHAVAVHFGVVTDRYKLVHYPATQEWELFDLEADPLEIRSVYNDPTYAEVQARLNDELAHLRAELDVPR